MTAANSPPNMVGFIGNRLRPNEDLASQTATGTSRFGVLPAEARPHSSGPIRRLRDEALRSIARTVEPVLSPAIGLFAPDTATSLREGVADLEQEEGGVAIVGNILGQAGLIGLTAGVGSAVVGSRAAAAGTAALLGTSTGVTKFRETDDLLSAVGAGAIEIASEYTGLEIIHRVSTKQAAKIGRLLMRGETGKATKLLASLGIVGVSATSSGTVEGLEEVLSLGASELFDVAIGSKKLDDALLNIQENVTGNFVGGFGAGVLLGAGGALTARPANAKLILERTIRDLAGGLQIPDLTLDDIGAPSRVNTLEQDLAALSETLPPGGAAIVVQTLNELATKTEDTKVAAKLQELAALAQENVGDELLADPNDATEITARTNALFDTESQASDLDKSALIARLTTSASKGAKRSFSRAERGLSAALRVAADPSKSPTFIAQQIDSFLTHTAGLGKKFTGILKGFDGTSKDLALRLNRIRESVREKIRADARSAIELAATRLDTKDIRTDFKAQINSALKSVGLTLESLKGKNTGDITAEIDKTIAHKTPNELIAVANHIREAIAQNAVAQRSMKALRNAEFADVIEQMRHELELNPLLKTKGTDAEGRLEQEADQSVLRLLKLTTGKAGNGTLDNLAEILSGSDGSLTHEVLIGSLLQFRERALAVYFNAQDTMLDAINAAGYRNKPEDIGQLSRGMSKAVNGFARATTGRSVTPITYKIEFEKGGVANLDLGQALMLWVTLQDAETRAIVFGENNSLTFRGLKRGTNFQMTENDLAALEVKLGKNLTIGKAFLQWANSDQIKGMVARFTTAHMGRDITRPDTWATRHRQPQGDEITVDPKRVVQSSLETLGYFEERTGGTEPLIINDLFTEWNNLGWGIGHVTQLAPVLQRARTAIKNKALRADIRESNMSDVLFRFDETYDQVVKEVVAAPHLGGVAEAAFKDLALKAAQGMLALRPTIASYQLASLGNAANELGVAAIAQALAEGAAFSSAVQALVEAIPSLRLRSQGGGAQFVSEGMDAEVSFAGVRGGGDAAFFMVRAMDAMVIRVIVRAAQIKAMATGEDAQFLAARTVNRTQPTWDTLSSTGHGIEARRNGVWRVFNMYRSQRAKNIDYQIRMTYRKARGEIGLARYVRSTAYTLVYGSMYIAAMQELWDLLRSLWLDGDDKTVGDHFKSWASRTISVATGNVLFGDTIYAPIKAMLFPDEPVFDPSFSPVQSMAEDFTRSTVALSKSTGQYVRGEKGFRQAYAKNLDDVVKAAAISLVLWKGAPVLFISDEAAKVIRDAEKNDAKNRGRIF